MTESADPPAEPNYVELADAMCEQCSHNEDQHQSACRVKGCPCSRFHPRRARLEAELGRLRTTLTETQAERDQIRVQCQMAMDQLVDAHQRGYALGSDRAEVAEAALATTRAARDDLRDIIEEAHRAVDAAGVLRYPMQPLTDRIGVLGAKLTAITNLALAHRDEENTCDVTEIWPSELLALLGTDDAQD